MKRNFLILILALVVWAVMQSGTAFAFLTTYTFWAPPYNNSNHPNDLWDLDHYSYYTWGLRWTPQANERIVQARLTIFDINNWTQEDDDALYIHLLKNAPAGARTYADNQGGGDNFANWATPQILLDTYTDLNDYPGPAENYRYRFSRNDLRHLNRWAEDGNFGFGFDPDCHYWNNGIRFQFETQTIPEPASLSLLGLGLLGAALRRKIA